MNALGFQELKVIALAVEDPLRADVFYRNTLDLQPAIEGGQPVGFMLGNLVILLKSVADGWPCRPSANLNPRLTFATENAPQTERTLRQRGVTITDRVTAYPEEGYCVGAFLDSEGNKLWFCSLLPQPAP